MKIFFYLHDSCLVSQSFIFTLCTNSQFQQHFNNNFCADLIWLNFTKKLQTQTEST